jgi:hypothetical protein
MSVGTVADWLDSIKTRDLAGLARLSDHARLGKQAVAVKAARDWKTIFTANLLQWFGGSGPSKKPHRGKGAKALVSAEQTPVAMLQ